MSLWSWELSPHTGGEGCWAAEVKGRTGGTDPLCFTLEQRDTRCDGGSRGVMAVGREGTGQPVALGCS